eukprot:6791219-Pyramimonas_sp.AAC.1
MEGLIWHELEHPDLLRFSPGRADPRRAARVQEDGSLGVAHLAFARRLAGANQPRPVGRHLGRRRRQP